MNIEKKEEYDCSVSDEKCFPHTFKNKKRTDPYLKDGKCIIHRLPKLNLKDNKGWIWLRDLIDY